MKGFIKILIVSILLPAGLSAQTVPVPDQNFLAYLKTNFPAVIDANDELIISEAANVTGTINCYNLSISNLEGIQYFTGIQYIYAGMNQITSLPDISGLTELEVLNVSENQLNALPPLNNQTKLRKLMAYSNQLVSLPELSSCTLLTNLMVYHNQLQALPDLSALSNLRELEAGSNQLSALPDLTNQASLERLLAWANKISTTPDLSGMPNLKVLNLASNELTVTPDVSASLYLEELILNHNFLTGSPDLSAHDSLRHVILEYNHLTFEDLVPYTSRPDFSEVFSVYPQRTVKVAEHIHLEENGAFILAPGIDTAIDGTQYNWYKDGALVQSGTEETLTRSFITFSDSGSYHMVVEHPSLPGVQLTTDTFSVHVSPCLDITGLIVEVTGIDCISSGSVIIDTTAYSGLFLTYTLESSATGKIFTSSTGHFKGLSEPGYILSVQASPACVKTYGPVNVPVTGCEDIFITPDNDGDKDSYFFSATGTARIYDKKGTLVTTLQIPSTWDGSSNSGKVPPGYYVVDINQGEDFINITVIY